MPLPSELEEEIQRQAKYIQALEYNISQLASIGYALANYKENTVMYKAAVDLLDGIMKVHSVDTNKEMH